MVYQEVAQGTDIKVGDKVEATDLINDFVVQGIVTNIRPAGYYKTDTVWAVLKGGRSIPLVDGFKARNFTYRILVRPGPVVGDSITWDEIFDLPAGSVVVRSDRELMTNPNRVTWIVTKRKNGEPRLRNAAEGTYTHDRPAKPGIHSYRYIIQYINENKG